MPDGTLTEQIPRRTTTLRSPDIRLVFPASEEAVRRALQSLRDSLGALGVDDLTMGTVEIVLAEAANNIVEHAYPDMSAGTIALSCCLEHAQIRFALCDTGAALPGGELPRKQHHDLASALDDLPEGGFGWGLIRDMTDALSYRRIDGRNVLRFSILGEEGDESSLS